jgi:hypothetical protein
MLSRGQQQASPNPLEQEQLGPKLCSTIDEEGLDDITNL